MSKKDQKTTSSNNNINNNINNNTHKRYQDAALAWDERVGHGKKQLNNWRTCALISFLITLLLVIALVFLSISTAPKVYIAQVGPKDQVQSVRLAGQRLTATDVQKAYFINKFINNFMSLPLDPVILRKNWLNAYHMSSGQAQNNLTKYVRKNNPFDKAGSSTQSIQIERYNLVSDNSFEFIWRQTTYDAKGKNTSIKRYSGVFTLQQGKVANNLQQLLINPFGLRVIFFSTTKLGSVA